MEIKIRNAVKSDALLIGRIVAMAIGIEGAQDYAGAEAIKTLAEVAEREDSQYSYSNALIAEVAGMPAGAIVAYDGGKLHTLREASLSVIRKYHPELEITDDETEPGEFYLDSIGVLPEFRGHGIAGKMISAMMDKASAEGFDCFGLLVDFDNTVAERLYRSIGFKPAGERPFFGHLMQHMQLHLPLHRC